MSNCFLKVYSKFYFHQQYMRAYVSSHFHSIEWQNFKMSYCVKKDALLFYCLLFIVLIILLLLLQESSCKSSHTYIEIWNTCLSVFAIWDANTVNVSSSLHTPNLTSVAMSSLWSSIKEWSGKPAVDSLSLEESLQDHFCMKHCSLVLEKSTVCI